MRPVVGLDVYIHTLPLDISHTYASCLSTSSMPMSRNVFLKKGKSTSSMIEFIILRGFLDLVLLSVVTVYSLGLTSVSFLVQYFLCFLWKGFRWVCESFLISLFGIVSDSLQSTVDQNLVFGLILYTLFPFYLLWKKRKRSYFKFLILKHKNKK